MSIAATEAWARLKEHVASMDRTHLRDLIQDPERCAALTAKYGDIFLDYSRQRVTPETMDLLFNLAETAGLQQKRAAMGSGEHINNTEDRAVMHIALRAPKDKTLYVDGQNMIPEVHGVLDRIYSFAESVRRGQWKGATGKTLTNVISIGIGGSYLGPEFVYEALRCETSAKAGASGRTLRFLANVDPVDVARATEGLDPEATLVIVVSKTFTTAETMLNARTLRDWLVKGIPQANASDVIRQHMCAASSAVQKATDFGIAEANIFGFWNWVGGRFSVCSAVGMLPLSLHFGPPTMQLFLEGAHDMDQHFFEAPIRQNLPVLLGLLGVWNCSFLGYQSRALLPYGQALVRFAAHIQQVDMESNGKRVTSDGVEVDYETGEVNFGEPGTNGQHSFYQLMHQGKVIPADFIGFAKSQNHIELSGEEVSNHDELMSNFFAQPDALAAGKTLEELEAEGVPEPLRPHKQFPGNRPSSSLILPCLNAYTCGQLLSLFEHRTAVQGFIWGINSFDQWGVELGKVLAKRVRGAFNAARKKKQGANAFSTASFNPSTSALLGHYFELSNRDDVGVPVVPGRGGSGGGGGGGSQASADVEGGAASMED